MSARWDQITKRLYFKYVRTIAKIDEGTGDEDNSPVIGLTNDGIRINRCLDFRLRRRSRLQGRKSKNGN